MRPADVVLRVIVAGALALLAGCSPGGQTSEGATDQRPAVPVHVAEAVRKDAPVALQAIGNVQAYATVAVKAQVDGRLERVNFTEGQEVKQDDLLFVVDARPFESALREAEGRLARDRAQAEQATIESRRFAKLIQSGVVSADEYDRARSQAASFAAAVTADEAAVESARIQVQFCSIHAPIDGRVGELLVHAGNVVKENDTTLAVINQLRPVYVEFSVPQQELPRIREHMGNGALSVDAYPPGDTERAVAGKLSFIDNAIDRTTGTVLLKGVFPNQDERLWPGQFLNVTVTLATRPDALMIPARAVQTGQLGKYVFVVRPDGTAESRAIRLGSAFGEEVVVEEGLAPGDRVVTDGQLRLAPGIRVEVKDAAA
jgi:multidrug efflux system membrane fusion protein